MIPYPVSHNVEVSSVFTPTDISSLVLWYDPNEVTDTGSDGTADVLLNQATAPVDAKDANTAGTAVPAIVSSGYTAGEDSITYDGSQTYYSTVSYSELQFATSDPWSISFWIKPDAGNYYILDSTSTGRGGAAGMGIYFESNILRVELLNTAGGEYSHRTGSVQDPGVWHQYTITYDGSESSAGFVIYEDGVLLSSLGFNNIIFADTTHNTGTLEIGRSKQTGADWLDADLGHVMIFDAVLTSQNISDLATYY